MGAAKVDLTPPLHVPFLGFEPRQGIFEGVHDPLYARAAVFASPDSAVAILSADALGLSTDLLGPGRDFVAEVRERVGRASSPGSRVGLNPDHILLAATHAHSTPDTYGITRLWERADCTAWLETFADQLVSAVQLAWRDRRPARLAWGASAIAGLARNRRAHADPGFVDESVTVLLAEREDAPPVVLANFACHPVTVQVQPLVSADYPGVGTAVVERTLGGGSCCLFLQGAAGDINPIKGDSRDWRDVQTYGLMLAGGILQAVGQARLQASAQAPAVAARRTVLSLQAREASTVEEAAATRDAAEQALAATARVDPEYQQRYGAARLARETYRLAQFGPGPVPAEVQVLRIGEVAIAAFPGELFCSLGLRVKEQSSAPATMIAECANGCLGYLAPRESWEEGGYEVGPGAWCRTAAGEAERLVEAAEGLLHQLSS